MKGIVPSIGKDILELNPVSMINVFMTGSSPNGDFTPLPCRETFTGKKVIDDKNHNILILIVVFCSILFIFNIFKKNKDITISRLS